MIIYVYIFFVNEGVTPKHFSCAFISNLQLLHFATTVACRWCGLTLGVCLADSITNHQKSKACVDF